MIDYLLYPHIFGQKGIIGLLVEGINNPALAISKDKPKPFKAAVLPPVFGPVIATTLVFLFMWKSTATGGEAAFFLFSQINNGCEKPIKETIGFFSKIGVLPPIHFEYLERVRAFSSLNKMDAIL